MSNLPKLAEQMRADWDRRVRHDYRFWMSDGHESDEAMWASGERDLEILRREISDCENKTFLEIGCGVGRILKAASSRFKSVIGVDVSAQAIERARKLLNQIPNLKLEVGNGLDLSMLADGSIDLVVSFASITSMPTPVIANYLLEIRRVLKPGGICRLQVYLGNPQPVAISNTLHLRSFTHQNFERAVQAAGLTLSETSRLELPFEVSFKDLGFEALIVTLRPQASSGLVTADQISTMLLPQGESDTNTEYSDDEIESWMTLNYAKQLIGNGDYERAREAIEYVTEHFIITSIDVKDLLDEIVNRLDRNAQPKNASITISSPDESSSILPQNLEVLKKRFSKIAAEISRTSVNSVECQIRSTQEGPAVFLRGQCLDHPDKPMTAARAWAKRMLQDGRVRDCKRFIVFGLGAGYHVEALLELGDYEVGVVEPSEEVLKAVLSTRDISKLLSRLCSLEVGQLPEPRLDAQHSELLIRPQSQALYGDYSTKVKQAFFGTRGLEVLKPNIAVLGPLQGGTLAITEYATRGLASIAQRARSLDVSGFAKGYHEFEKFVREPIRQRTLEGNYVEMVSQVVLEAVNERPIDILVCMAQAPLSGRVLTELRNRGVITALWFTEDYLRFGYWREMAHFYDFVFPIQRGACIDAIRSAGAGEVHYLPMACDPIVHRPLSLTAEEKARWGSPISFVGAGYHNRQQVFAALAETPFKLWGTEWPNCRPFDRMLQEGGRRISAEEYVKIFNATDININLHSSSERDGVDPTGDFVNPRTFELAAAGCFQLVDQRSLLHEVFEPNKDLVVFDSATQMREQIDYYLAHPHERLKFVERARARALKEHTYAHRMREMLSLIYSAKFEYLYARQENSPWRKLLKRAEPHEELSDRCQQAYGRGEEAVLDGLVVDIVNGKGKLSETEQKLLFLFHVRKQIIRMKAEEAVESK